MTNLHTHAHFADVRSIAQRLEAREEADRILQQSYLNSCGEHHADAEKVSCAPRHATRTVAESTQSLPQEQISAEAGQELLAALTGLTDFAEGK